MRIAHCNIHSCARVFKIAWQQILDGNEVHLITERFIHGHPWKDFAAVHITETGYLNRGVVNPEHLASTVRAISPVIDVFWCHNEPDWIVKVVKENSNKPVIWDIHDMVSMRTGSVDEWEKDALDCCDGISVVSQEYKENIKKRTDKPVEEILSCVPGFMFPKTRPSMILNGLVYEGGLKGVSKVTEQFEYRNWSETFKKITQSGVPMYAYNNSSAEDLSNYAGTQTIFMGPLHMGELISNLTAHEVGLVGSPSPNPAFIGSLPNKLFEYIAAGLPVIALNSPTTANFLEVTGMGVGISSVDEIPAIMNSLLGYDDPEEESARDYVWNRGRHAWTMESQMKKVYGLIEKVVNK